MFRIVSNGSGGTKLDFFNEETIAVTTAQTLPSDCYIGTPIFIVDKLDVAFCDGNDNWYREAGKPVAAGQPVSALF